MLFQLHAIFYPGGASNDIIIARNIGLDGNDLCFRSLKCFGLFFGLLSGFFLLPDVITGEQQWINAVVRIMFLWGKNGLHIRSKRGMFGLTTGGNTCTKTGMTLLEFSIG